MHAVKFVSYYSMLRFESGSDAAGELVFERITVSWASSIV